MASRLADLPFCWLRSIAATGGVLAGVAGATCLPAYAQTSWIGTTSTDWFTGSNWNTGVVPTPADLVVINTITPNPTEINGGAAVAAGSDIGNSVASQGMATVTGAGSTWTNGGLLSVGTFGTGTLTVENGGMVSNTNGFIGFAAGSQGAVTVTGAGSTWTNSGVLSVGDAGAGALAVENGGVVSSVNGVVGSAPGAQGAVTVTGAGSAWTNSGLLSVGQNGTGTLAISNGGIVSSDLLTVGQFGTGTLTIGTGGIVSSGLLAVGQSGAGTLAIENAGTLITSMPGADIGEGVGSQGAVTVTGAGSTWTNSGLLSVGTNGTGTLSIANGAVVSNTDGFVGFATGSQGAVTVTGAGSTWTSSGALFIGRFGIGMLTISNGGTVNVGAGAGAVSVANQAGSTGTLNIGAAPGDPAGAPGVLNAAIVAFGAGTGNLNFNHTAANYVFAPQIIGNGAVNVFSGTTIFTSDNTYSGGTNINSGTLQLGNGGTTGSILGDVVNNGVFAINRSDTFTFAGVVSGTGALAQIGSGTTLLTATNTYAGGTMINAGTLAVAADVNLGAAAGGLTFGGGTLQFLSGFIINRPITLNTGGGTFDTNGNNATLSGPIAGTGGLNKIGAGTLVLSGANTYSGGTTLAAGALRLENNQALGTGVLTTTGSVVDYAPGITIANPIALNSDTTQLSVTTGSATQAGVISELNGPRPLEKIGAGTLVLTAANTYSGSTTISAGTLQLGNGGVSGSISATWLTTVTSRSTAPTSSLWAT